MFPPAAITADPFGAVVAFGAGMLSFLSPCVLPLVPGYVSMVSGLSAAELGAAETGVGPGGSASPAHGHRVTASATLSGAERRRLLVGIGGFVAGFTVVFTALGATASSLGHLLIAHQRQLDTAAGALIVALGIVLVGVGVPTPLLRERRFHVRPSVLGVWAPPVMGMAFAFGWTPCIGPVLGAVLGLATVRSTLVGGVLLLLSYSLGLGVPFFVTGLAFGRVTALARRLRSVLRLVNTAGGVVLVAFGLLLLTHRLGWVSGGVTSFLDHVGLGRLTVS